MGFSLSVGPRDLVFEFIFKEESYLIINQGYLACMFIQIVLVFVCVCVRARVCVCVCLCVCLCVCVCM